MKTQEKQESVSALVVSLMRACHSRYDQKPLIDDPYGIVLTTAAERAALCRRLVERGECKRAADEGDGGDGERALAPLRSHRAYGNIILRTCYAEDRLDAALSRGVVQYVVLGAGLDSFALRRSDLAARLRVFEVDHPASQASKRQRLAAAGLQPPENLVFLPVDFERASLASALAAATFNAGALAFFSWLGVSPYLTRPAHLQTLASVAGSAAGGCELVFNYVRTAGEGGSGAAAPAAPQTAEPIISRFDPSDVRAMLESSGFEVVEDLGAAELTAMYGADRPDVLRPAPNFRIVHARTAGR